MTVTSYEQTISLCVTPKGELLLTEGIYDLHQQQAVRPLISLPEQFLLENDREALTSIIQTQLHWLHQQAVEAPEIPAFTYYYERLSSYTIDGIIDLFTLALHHMHQASPGEHTEEMQSPPPSMENLPEFLQNPHIWLAAPVLYADETDLEALIKPHQDQENLQVRGISFRLNGALLLSGDLQSRKRTKAEEMAHRADNLLGFLVEANYFTDGPGWQSGMQAFREQLGDDAQDKTTVFSPFWDIYPILTGKAYRLHYAPQKTATEVLADMVQLVTEPTLLNQRLPLLLQELQDYRLQLQEQQPEEEQHPFPLFHMLQNAFNGRIGQENSPLDRLIENLEHYVKRYESDLSQGIETFLPLLYGPELACQFNHFQQACRNYEPPAIELAEIDSTPLSPRHAALPADWRDIAMTRIDEILSETSNRALLNTLLETPDANDRTR